MTTELRTKLAVPAEKLRRTIDPEAIAAAPTVSDAFGQKTALAAVELGLLMTADKYSKSHYHIAVVGSTSTGRTKKTIEFIERHAAGIDRPPPDVLCLHDFAAPRRPSIVYVPNGAGQPVAKRLQLFAKTAVTVLPGNLAGIRETRGGQRDAMFIEWRDNLADLIRGLGFFLNHEKDGYLVAVPSPKDPTRPLDQADHDALTPEDRAEVDKVLASDKYVQASELISLAIAGINKTSSLFDAETDKLVLASAQKAIGAQTQKLREMTGGGDKIFDRFLTELGKKLVAFVIKEDDKVPQNPLLALAGKQGNDEVRDLLHFAMANVLVDNRGIRHPPVVHVDVPHFSKLFGHINAQVVNSDGAIRVDHTMIDAGAILKANGGIVVIDLGRLLKSGGALAFYKMLEVARTQRLQIEGKSKFADAEGTLDFRPAETPIDVRFILICDRYMARMIGYAEPEFDNLFRIVAEFDEVMDAGDAVALFKTLVMSWQADNPHLKYTDPAIAKLIECFIRRAGDQRKVSAEIGIVKDYIAESVHRAIQSGSLEVLPEHVVRTHNERFNRQSLSVRRYQDHMDRSVLFDFEGAKVGQMNGLAVMTRSREIRFGTPLRITARVYAGAEKVVLVQREVGLSGPSMDMSIAVLRGYLSGQYGRKRPLSLSVQLCFEQCMDIDGDSASLAETIATISAITGLPADQRLAITGSMNQMGEAQAIGGINEKIEGHFGAIKRRGLLKPGHGVVMPVSNLDNLMLSEEVVEAQRQGLYQVYAVTCLDEALEIFLGRPAKEIHALVRRKLAAMRALAVKDKRKAAAPDPKDKKNPEPEPKKGPAAQSSRRKPGRR